MTLSTWIQTAHPGDRMTYATCASVATHPTREVREARSLYDRGLLRRMDDGSYVIRAKWQGPRKPASIEAAKERAPRRYCKTCMFSSENPLTKDCRAPNCGLNANQSMEEAA